MVSAKMPLFFYLNGIGNLQDRWDDITWGEQGGIEMKERYIITSDDLRGDINEERRKLGLHEIPAGNVRSAANSCAHLDKSFCCTFDYFRQQLSKKK